MDVLYITHETWMTCPSHMQELGRREREITGRSGRGQKCGKSTYTHFLCEDKTLVATVEPSELQGPPGSSLPWSVTWVKVL